MKQPSNILSSPSSKYYRLGSWFVVALILLVATIFFVPDARAVSVDVSPIILDWEGQRRDEFRETISITNNTGRVVTVWPTIVDIDAQTGEMRVSGAPGGDQDRLSAWVEMKRTNIYLTPGKTKTVGLKVKSNVHADIGTYHGIIAFPVAESFEDAEHKIEGAGKTSVTVRVLEDRVEQLNIRRFSALKRVLLAFPAVFNLEVENGGNVEMPIKGKIRFFDRQDNEVGERVFSGDELVAPDDTLPIAIDWSGSGTFGRHKAFIELKYGNGNVVTDSSFFYVIPWWALATFAGLVVLSVALVTRLFARAHRHHQ